MNDIPEAGKPLRAKYNKQVFSITTQDCPSDVINKKLLSFTHKCVPYTCIEVPINANDALTHHTVNSAQQVFHYIVSLWFNDNSLYIIINNDITHLKTVLNKFHEDKSELYRHLLFFAIEIHFDANEKFRNTLLQTNTICSSLNVVHD